MKYFKHPGKDVRDKYWLLKSVLIMKLTCILIVFFNLQAVANSYSQSKVTIDAKSVDFKKVINLIQKQTNYHFVFSERKIPATQKVDINVENEDVTTVLDKMLNNTGYTYKQMGNNLIVITRNSAEAFASVTGKVVDEKGEPLPGVTVKIKGTSTATATNADGAFQINAADDATLVISFLGYETQEVAVGGRSVITISMIPANKSLNEVVVTALGIRKEERNLGYALSTVNGNALNQAKETNVALSLEGRVAGLNISGTNGGPASSARILLRGVTSLGAVTGPLFVINGVPMDNSQRGSSSEWGGADYGDGISNLNPDDIESMTILKGQAASALYGTRASNGVILITTKTGKKGTPYGVEYNTNYQFDIPVNNFDFQTEYGQGLNGNKPTSVASALASGSLAWGSRLDGSSTIQFDGNSYPYKNVSNYLDYYKTGGTFTNTVTFSGGSDVGSFRLSASDLNNHAIVPNSGLERKTFNFNGTLLATKKLEINAIANYVIDQGKNRSSLSDGPGNPNNVQFIAPNEDQKILNHPGQDFTFTNDSYVTNPYFAAYNFINNTSRNRLITTLSAKYNILSWLYALGRVGYDRINESRTSIEPTGTAYLSGSNGNMNVYTDQITELNSDVLLNGKHDIVKDLLNLNVAVGGNIRKSSSDGYYIRAANLIVPDFYSIVNGSQKTVVPFGSGPNSYPFAQQVNSAYYTADLALKDYLVLSTSGRYDAYTSISSNIGRGIFTPSVSGSFIFSELAHIDNVDFGKIRLSYAKTSGAPTPYANQFTYSIQNNINGLNSASLGYGTLPNLFLKPYTLNEFEVGAEMKFFKDRLGFDVDYFHRQTHDEILTATLDPSTGIGSYYVPTGSTQNQGVELELHGTPVKGAFTWTPSFNISYIKTKIVSTDENNNSVTLGTYRPLNANTAYVVGMAGPQIMAHDYVRNNGQIVYDSSGLPVQGALQPMGSVLPKFFGGLNNDFNYKHFNLSFLVDYKFGNKILSATNYYSIYRGLNKITLAGRDGGVVGQGVTASGAPNTVNVDAQTYYQALAQRISALNVLDGSFIKLRQVTFGYTVPNTTLRGTPFYSITASFVARNLWTIVKHSQNIDPESNFSASNYYAGIEGTSLPSTRTLGFNLNFKFKN